jgi:hypothetical protein
MPGILLHNWCEKKCLALRGRNPKRCDFTRSDCVYDTKLRVRRLEPGRAGMHQPIPTTGLCLGSQSAKERINQTLWVRVRKKKIIRAKKEGKLETRPNKEFSPKITLAVPFHYYSDISETPKGPNQPTIRSVPYIIAERKQAVQSTSVPLRLPRLLVRFVPSRRSWLLPETRLYASCTPPPPGPVRAVISLALSLVICGIELNPAALVHPLMLGSLSDFAGWGWTLERPWVQTSSDREVLNSCCPVSQLAVLWTRHTLWYGLV